MKDMLEKLLSLGNSPREVANSLLLRGIRGRRGSPRCCPIARFLARESGRYVSSGITRSMFFHPDSPSCDHPPNVRVFIVEFDRGSYPFLVEDT